LYVGRPRRFLREQIAGGKRLAVCTRDADGAIALNASREMIDMPAPHVPDLVDTNGAGDAFFAGFLAAHLAGGALRQCLDQVTEAAASCVRSRDLAATASSGDAATASSGDDRPIPHSS
jgi:sugar/nucleoside kinase (ribokinase family)